jgi:natural product precursor
MKKIKFEKKLSLSKETIAKLNGNQLTELKGGGTNTCPSDCFTCVTCPTTVLQCPTNTCCCVTNTPSCD